MVRVAVVGGGASGEAIRRALVARDASVEMLSRSTGFDVLRDDAASRIGEADVIVDAAGYFTTSRRKATDFFTTCTRSVASAARKLGARHILLSIVNCELPEVQGYGYFAAKAEQERIARQESERLTLVRTTQWFEFAGQNLDRMKLGPIALVPSMMLKPIALHSVAEVIADSAIGHRTGVLHEVAGPEMMTLWEMTKQLPRKGPRPVPLPVPTGYGRAFRRGVLVPGDGVEVVGPRFTDWLRTGY